MRTRGSMCLTVLATVLLLSCASRSHAELVGLWRFDQNTPTQPDSSGKGGDAIPQNEASWVNDAQRGGVYEFDGEQDYLEVEDSDALSVEGAITIMAWAKFNTFDTWNGIVTKGGVVHSNYPAPYDVYTNQGGDGRVQFYVGGDDAIAQVFSDVAPDLEDWQHIAVTWSEDGDVTHYLNGEVNGIGFIDMEAIPPTDADQPLYIGARQDFVTNMNGWLDDVAIFNEALSEEQVLKAMAGDFSEWIGGGPGTPGDYNNDGVLDVADYNAIAGALRAGNAGPEFDADANGTVNDDDRIAWVTTLKKTWIGDANFDGEFNSGDFVQVFQRGEYEDSVEDNSTWDDGDWNNDQDFDSGDFVAAFQGGGFEVGPRAAVSAVPEPSSLCLLLCGSLFWLARRR